jgi:hypothetical protein
MPSYTALKILGAASVASYVVARIAVRAGWLGWHRQHIIAVPRAALPTMPRGFVVRELGPEDLSLHRIDADAGVQQARFAAGLICLGVFNARELLIGVVWLSGHGGREAGIPLDLMPPEGAGWDTGMWIHPDHRLGRGFAALWAGVGEWLDGRGLTWSYSAIADYNVASLTAHRRLGAVEISTFIAVRLGRWQWVARGQDRWRLALGDRPLHWALPEVAREGAFLPG